MKKLIAILVAFSLLPAESWSFSAPPTTAYDSAPYLLFSSQALLLPIGLERTPFHAQSSSNVRRWITVRHQNSDAPTADLLGPFIHLERWEDTPQLLWALASALTEEFIFRWWWIGDPVKAFDGATEKLVVAFLSATASVIAFDILHPILKWVARAAVLDVSPTSRLYWRSLGRELSREITNIQFHFSRSYLFPSILFTVTYIGVAALTSPVIGWLSTTVLHTAYNELLDKVHAKDPIPARRKGQQAQMALLQSIANNLEDDRWRTSNAAMGDGDKFGDNNRFGKNAIGILGNPTSTDLFIYKKSLFLEMRELQIHLFKKYGLDLYRGVGGDELEPVLHGDPADVQRRLSAIVRAYADFYHARYAFYEVGPKMKSDLTGELFEGLKKMPGVVVHLRHGNAGVAGQEGYTIVIDRAEFVRHVTGSDRTIRGYMDRHFGPDFDLQEILLRNDKQSTFTVTFGAVSWGNVLKKALQAPDGRQFWLEPDGKALRKERLEAFYKFGMELANQVLGIAKEAGRNRALVADWEQIEKLPPPAIEKSDAKAPLALPWQVQLDQKHIALNTMSYGALREGYARHPADYIYHVIPTNWIDGHLRPIVLRALHSLNEKAQYSRADLVIEAFAEVLPSLFPRGASLNMARVGDAFVITSPTRINEIMGFFQPYFEETLRRKLMEKNGGRLSDDDQKFLSEINPFFVIYRTSLAEHKAIRKSNAMFPKEIENPLQLLDFMSSADMLFEQASMAVADAASDDGSVVDGERRLIDLEKLNPSLTVSIDRSKRYALVSLDASKSASLSATYRETQQRQRTAAKVSFAKYLGGSPVSIDALDPPKVDDFSDRLAPSGPFSDFFNELKNFPSTWMASPFGKAFARRLSQRDEMAQSA